MSQQTLEKLILVVDDDQEILNVVREILTIEGYRVQTSLNGACFQGMERDLPNLILLDVLLQGEDGRELCQRVKSYDLTRSIPVILFSANMAANSSITACGADDFLAKPFLIEDLLDRVANKITVRQNDLN
jgi:DNA-binding response OmpR family regulator